MPMLPYRTAAIRPEMRPYRKVRQRLDRRRVGHKNQVKEQRCETYQDVSKRLPRVWAQALVRGLVHILSLHTVCVASVDHVDDVNQKICT